MPKSKKNNNAAEHTALSPEKIAVPSKKRKATPASETTTKKAKAVKEPAQKASVNKDAAKPLKVNDEVATAQKEVRKVGNKKNVAAAAPSAVPETTTESSKTKKKAGGVSTPKEKQDTKVSAATKIASPAVEKIEKVASDAVSATQKALKAVKGAAKKAVTGAKAVGKQAVGKRSSAKDAAAAEDEEEEDGDLDPAVAFGDIMFGAGSPEPEGAQDVESDDSDSSDVNDRDLLQGLDVSDGSDGEDSSDDDEPEKEDIDLDRLMAKTGEHDSFATLRGAIALDPKNQAALQKKLAQAAKMQDEAKRGIVYLGRIPHGFYEAEMRGYFSQFGDITRLRLSRNKKGASRHFAFIEFKSSEVARIVAETMHDYLMSGRLLQCKVVPAEKLHPDTFKHANRTFVDTKRVLRKEISTRNRPMTDASIRKRNKRNAVADAERRKTFAAKGINYEF